MEYFLDIDITSMEYFLDIDITILECNLDIDITTMKYILHIDIITLEYNFNIDITIYPGSLVNTRFMYTLFSWFGIDMNINALLYIVG